MKRGWGEDRDQETKGERVCIHMQRRVRVHVHKQAAAPENEYKIHTTSCILRYTRNTQEQTHLGHNQETIRDTEDRHRHEIHTGAPEAQLNPIHQRRMSGLSHHPRAGTTGI